MGKRLMSVMIIALATCLAASGAFAQDQTQGGGPQKQKQTSKKARVWTNDDVGSLRTPADSYQEHQDAAAQEPAAKQSEAGQQAQGAAATAQNPKTVQEADSMIAKKKQDLESQRAYVQQLQTQLQDPTVAGKDRERLEWRLKSRSLTADQTQSDIADLQAQRDALAKKPADASTTSSPQP